jgi:hypothetical protein
VSARLTQRLKWRVEFAIADWRQQAILNIVHMVPRWLVYWCGIRLMAEVWERRGGAHHDITVDEALQWWERPDSNIRNTN